MLKNSACFIVFCNTLDLHKDMVLIQSFQFHLISVGTVVNTSRLSSKQRNQSQDWSLGSKAMGPLQQR